MRVTKEASASGLPMFLIGYAGATAPPFPSLLLCGAASRPGLRMGEENGLGHSPAAPSADRRRQLPEAYRILIPCVAQAPAASERLQ
jgi:hypothetical protein